MFFFFVDPNKVAEGPELKLLAEMLDIVRADYPNMSVGALRTFIEIARTEKNICAKVNLTSMANKMNVKYTTLARQLDMLGDGMSGRKGAGLLSKQNTENKKNKTIEFTPSGVLLLTKIANAISDTKKIRAGVND